ncbi:MAG: ABC-F family ATP-binding cassette domain-containing protein [Clostridiales bacterium]|nr:ABC-F family ATP-binding cassette domain-containing protein [Clostridiales bacterium]
MRILKITELSHSFVEKSIFNNAEMVVDEGDKIGIVGPNGSGKSSLLKMIVGQIVPDNWKIQMHPNTRIGYLDQYADIDRMQTVNDYLYGSFTELYKLNNMVDELYASVDELNVDEQMRAIEKAQNILDLLEKKEFERIDKKVESVLYGLGFQDADLGKSISQLSGGMKTKLILGRLLLSDFDLLILDEPTNFLDIGYIEWLGDYLAKYKGTFIVISHDKAFLNKVTTKTVEIANRKLKSYKGNYDAYLKEKEQRDAVQEKQAIAQEKYVKWAQERVAQEEHNETKSAKYTWLKKMLANLERIEHPDEIVKPQFEFKHKHGASHVIIEAQKLSVGYNGTAILPPLDLTVKRGEKVVFKGFNGIGKTTLLKTLCGELEAVSGQIEYGKDVFSVFIKQEEDYDYNFSHFDKIDRKTMGLKKFKERNVIVIEFARDHCPDKPQKQIQGALQSCGIKPSHFFNPVRTLSGGEMTRLRLCLAMQNPVNLIVLDEPTNHLDVYSKEVLMHALEEFQGTVLMTTHDVNVDISWATRVIDLEELFS